MKSSFITAAAIFFSIAASSAAAPQDPQRPDDATKQRLLELIGAVGKARSSVASTAWAWKQVRGKGDDETELDRLEAYRTALSEQDRAARNAIEAIQDAYEVAPARQVGYAHKPLGSDSGYEWVDGLPAQWRPEIVFADGDARRVTARDGSVHYLMESDLVGLGGATYLDGEVVIPYQTLLDAYTTKSPGIVAALLYHEAQHFSRVISVSMGDSEHEEIRAYSAVIAHLDVFEMPKEWNDTQRAALAKYKDAAKAGTATRFGLSAADEQAARGEVEASDRAEEDLARYYLDLKNRVEAARQAQQAAEARRRQEEIDRMTAKAEMLAEVRNQIDKCDVDPLYGSDGRTFIGFRVTVNGWPASYAIAHDMTIEELKTALMFARACLDVTMLGVDPAEVRPCNDGADIAAQHWTDAAFRSDAQFRVAPEQQVRCLRYVYDHWTTPMTAKRTARILSGARAEYRKAVDENWRREEKEREDAEESERERRTPRERPERPEPEERHSPTPHFHCGFNSGGAYCE